MGKRVLIVDNAPARSAKLRALCSRLGLEVLEASDGREGLRQAIEHHPDLLLVESSAASIGLHELAELAAEDERTAWIPIVALVSAGDIRTITHYRRLGVHIVPRNEMAALRSVLSRAAESEELHSLFPATRPRRPAAAAAALAAVA